MSDLTAVIDAFVADAGNSPEQLPVPDGYVDAGLAVVDAIYSIRANYTSTMNVVRRYAAFAGVPVTMPSRRPPGPACMV